MKKKKTNRLPVVIILLILLLAAKGRGENRAAASAEGSAPTQAPLAVLNTPMPTFAFVPTATPRRVGDFVFRARDVGPCGKLTGNVKIVLTFVSTPQHPWTEKQKSAVAKVTDSSIRVMENDAARYGAYLDLEWAYLECGIPMEYTSYQTDSSLEWYHYLLDNYFHMNTLADLCEYWKGDWHKDSVVIIFLFNSWDVSHAYVCNSNDPQWTDEFCVIFCDTNMHDNYLTHEVLHLYGAIDLYDYDGEGVQRVAEKYFPKSNMLGTAFEADDLTAYLVGWMDAMTWDAWMFVQEVDGLRD